MADLTPFGTMGYTALVTSKKGVIGFDSPVQRGEGRINREVCGFSFGRSSFGGADRRAQALPVCLRVARSVNLSALPPSLTVGRQLFKATTGGHMANALTPFNFGQNTIRTTTIGEAVWFVATDVAEALGYRNAPDASRHLDDDEKGTQIVRTPGGPQTLTIINESGLYALVLRSRKPEARKFAKWVTSEVLPSIRKTGHYTPQKALPVHTGGIRISDLIAAGNGIYLETEELHRIAAVCLEKLASRAKFYQVRAIQ